MNSLIVAAGSVGLVLLVGLIITIYWLSKARKGQVKAEAEATALREGNAKRVDADKIMAEPVADESAWLVTAAERLRDSRR